MKIFKYIPLVALSFMACGDETTASSENGSGSTADLLIKLEVAPCVATFKQDYNVLNWFDEVEFTAKAGEEFVIQSGPSSFSSEIDLYKVVGDAAFDFSVSPDENSGELPFESNCDLETSSADMVTLVATDVYSDTLATQKVCSIPAGIVVSEGGGGFAYENDDQGYTVYEIYANIDYEGCTKEAKYVRALEVDFKETTYTIVPINFIEVP